MVGKPRARRRRPRRLEPAQLVLFKKRGGKRRGAGRTPKGRRAGSPHRARPELKARHPVHVVLRVIGAVGSLRRRFTYRAIREATLTTARREDFRIVHLSIQRTHVHLLVEADDKGALASGMQGFQISAAKHLNAAISKGKPGPRRRGTVFPDRYHAEIITSPTQARHALAYVLCNWRKHKEDQRQPMREWTLDWFSTAGMFSGLGRVRRGRVLPVAAPGRDLRSTGRVPTQDLALESGLAEVRIDLLPRGPIGEAMTLLLDGDLALSLLFSSGKPGRNPIPEQARMRQR